MKPKQHYFYIRRTHRAHVISRVMSFWWKLQIMSFLSFPLLPPPLLPRSAPWPPTHPELLGAPAAGGGRAAGGGAPHTAHVPVCGRLPHAHSYLVARRRETQPGRNSVLQANTLETCFHRNIRMYTYTYMQAHSCIHWDRWRKISWMKMNNSQNLTLFLLYLH